MSEEKKRPEATIYSVGSLIRKADTELVTAVSEAAPEDAFKSLYASKNKSAVILQPLYPPTFFKKLVTENNTLMQCIEAMEVNIDGTGFSIEKVEGATEDKAQEQTLTDFFGEPYPGKSMVQLRRPLRNDIESTGNGYLEVITNTEGMPVLLNAINCNYMRLVELDSPVNVEKTIIRSGKEVKVTLPIRERRFAMVVGAKVVYYREFGSSRDVNKETGEWAPINTLPLDKRGSQVLHFKCKFDPVSPYGVPRWINQLPSVLGSRKAEMYNLDFFDAGGIPPILLLIKGGTLVEGVREQLEMHFSGKTTNRAAIVEAMSSSGNLDSSGTVDVSVERFSSERQNDAMFQNYDKSCAAHIGEAFRLPPLFLGKSGDFTFATAYVSYMVGEAQVFSPERWLFDDEINKGIVKALGVTDYYYRSLPMVIKDADKQLKALSMAASAESITKGELVSKLNEITDIEIEVAKGAEDEVVAMSKGAQTEGSSGLGASMGSGTSLEGGSSIGESMATKVSKEDQEEMLELAVGWSSVLGLGKKELSETEKLLIRKQVNDLDGGKLAVFNSYVVACSLGYPPSQDLLDLCECAGHLQ